MLSWGSFIYVSKIIIIIKTTYNWCVKMLLQFYTIMHHIFNNFVHFNSSYLIMTDLPFHAEHYNLIGHGQNKRKYNMHYMTMKLNTHPLRVMVLVLKWEHVSNDSETCRHEDNANASALRCNEIWHNFTSQGWNWSLHDHLSRDSTNVQLALSTFQQH